MIEGVPLDSKHNEQRLTITLERTKLEDKFKIVPQRLYSNVVISLDTMQKIEHQVNVAKFLKTKETIQEQEAFSIKAIVTVNPWIFIDTSNRTIQGSSVKLIAILNYDNKNLIEDFIEISK